MAERVDYAGKRAVDLAVAALVAVAVAPVLLATAVAVRLSSPGPVLHRATRIGRDGRPFTLYKFRSMRVDLPAAGPAITARGDARVTRVGGVLRRTKLDELPQLYNVLRGEMSIVGPRPEDPHYVARYTPEQRRILAWRPGFTSPASVAYRDEEAVLAASSDLEAAYETVMAEKLRLDLAYFPRSSLRGDARWMVRTAAAVAGRPGATAGGSAGDD